MSHCVYDAVIGGGITGAGVLRDLALRGVRALLVEKKTLGHATTAASSHLIHGGCDTCCTIVSPPTPPVGIPATSCGWPGRI
jgi:glycine/D-amino acid oxidase-like deaminating enzyme